MLYITADKTQQITLNAEKSILMKTSCNSVAIIQPLAHVVTFTVLYGEKGSDSDVTISVKHCECMSAKWTKSMLSIL